MSGLGKNAGSLTFVKIKDGKFYLSSDKENKEPYDSLTGYITDFRFKDEDFNNTKTRKLYVNIKSGDTTYSFSVSRDSSYMSSLVNFLKNANLKEEVKISPSIKTVKNDKGVDVKRYTMFVSQDDTPLKAFYTKDSEESLPQFKKVKLNGKVAWDKSDFLDALEEIILNELLPQVKKNKSTLIKEEKVIVDDVVEETEDDVVNELPWDND